MSERPDLAGLMRDHEYALQMRGGAICSCGHVPTVDPATLQTQQDYHRAHLAAALNAAIEAWLADEGTREAVAAELIDSGASPGSSLHSWRCEHPDRYGACDCVDETARDILAALAALTTPTTTEPEEGKR